MSTTPVSVDAIADAAVAANARRVRKRTSSGSTSVPEVSLSRACQLAQDELRRKFPRTKTEARLRRDKAAKRRMRENACSYMLNVAKWVTVLTNGCHETATARHADLAHELATSLHVDPLQFFGGDRGAVATACAVPVAVPVRPVVTEPVQPVAASWDSDDE